VPAIEKEIVITGNILVSNGHAVNFVGVNPPSLCNANSEHQISIRKFISWFYGLVS